MLLVIIGPLLSPPWRNMDVILISMVLLVYSVALCFCLLL
jgi:hypothetical protein